MQFEVGDIVIVESSDYKEIVKGMIGNVTSPPSGIWRSYIIEFPNIGSFGFLEDKLSKFNLNPERKFNLYDQVKVISGGAFSESAIPGVLYASALNYKGYISGYKPIPETNWLYDVSKDKMFYYIDGLPGLIAPLEYIDKNLELVEDVNPKPKFKKGDKVKVKTQLITTLANTKGRLATIVYEFLLNNKEHYHIIFDGDNTNTNHAVMDGDIELIQDQAKINTVVKYVKDGYPNSDMNENVTIGKYYAVLKENCGCYGVIDDRGEDDGWFKPAEVIVFKVGDRFKFNSTGAECIISNFENDRDLGIIVHYAYNSGITSSWITEEFDKAITIIEPIEEKELAKPEDLQVGDYVEILSDAIVGNVKKDTLTVKEQYKVESAIGKVGRIRYINELSDCPYEIELLPNKCYDYETSGLASWVYRRDQLKKVDKPKEKFVFDIAKGGFLPAVYRRKEYHNRLFFAW